MWLKRLVGIVMILTFACLNTLVVVGLFQPRHTHVPTVNASDSPATLAVNVPAVSISVNPAAIAANSTSGITWTTTGTPTSCVASGKWAGDKTIFGSESTGRISTPGTYTYTLTCQNKAGKAAATGQIVVTATAPSASQSQSKTTTATGTGAAITATYCNGRSPCYGKSDVSKHSGSGNCWGYNIDRVIDISGFDAGYHQTKSGISNIQVSGVCGTNLAPSLAGSVSADGQTRVHNSSTKSNADANEIPYFVGYFDANKP